MDISISFISVLFSIWLIYGGAFVLDNAAPIINGLLIAGVVFIISFRIFKTYKGVIRHSSVYDLFRVPGSMLLGSVICILLGFLSFPPSIFFPDARVILVYFFISTFFGIGARMLVKFCFDILSENSEEGITKIPIFIYGTHPMSESFAKGISGYKMSKFSVKGFITSDLSMQGHLLFGQPVFYSSIDSYSRMIGCGVRTLLVSPNEVDSFRDNEPAVDYLIENNVTIMILNAGLWDGKSEIQYSHLRNVQLEDLLPRNIIDINTEKIKLNFKNSSVLITGAAGSIGSEMVRQIVTFSPRSLILIDQAETPLHDIRRYLSVKYPSIEAHTIVSSVTHNTLMEKIFKEYSPDFVIHAAAYKHVPMMEDNPYEAIVNNIFGTRIIADLSVKYGVKIFAMVSTDKAVNPTNVMGCSKRICEIYCSSLNKAIKDGKVEGKTHFIITRFGNVLGSSGSVIPIFRQQIEAGGPVTVTDPEIERYFMLIPEACSLVLEAGAIGKGGEVFVFDMGRPVKIADMARKMIKLSGASDVKIVYTGLRDGEKLYEEVLSEGEDKIPTSHPKIKVAKVQEYEYDEILRNFEMLYQASISEDEMEMVRVMKQIVPEYKSNHSVYEILDK